MTRARLALALFLTASFAEARGTVHVAGAKISLKTGVVTPMVPWRQPGHGGNPPFAFVKNDVLVLYDVAHVEHPIAPVPPKTRLGWDAPSSSTLIIATEEPGVGNVVRAVDLQGKVLWKRIDADPLRQEFFMGPGGIALAKDGSLRILAPATGADRCKLSFAGNPFSMFRIEPTLDVYSAGMHVYGLDLVACKERWQAPLPTLKTIAYRGLRYEATEPKYDGRPAIVIVRERDASGLTKRSWKVGEYDGLFDLTPTSFTAVGDDLFATTSFTILD